ncbi:MAG: DNA helicase II / ATP-dependent DNA helicase PcrA, partial [Parcubacteria group bacterium Gr01-1014_66]
MRKSSLCEFLLFCMSSSDYFLSALLNDLNEPQQTAVTTTEGPLLILSGPGAGKTKTLTHRITYLLAKGTDPDRILGVTFTNKAAAEMRSRIFALLAMHHKMLHAIRPPLLATFHAFCLRLLRTHAPLLGFSSSFSLFDEDDSYSLLKEIMRELHIDPKRYAPSLLAHTISSLKNELISPDVYLQDHDFDAPFPQTVHRIYQRYQERLKGLNAMDFDDLLTHAVVLLNNKNTLLEEYQDRFQYLHVDEYQDTNHAQYVLIRLLAQKHRNIAVVGDDAQA